MDANSRMYPLMRKRAEEAYRGFGMEPHFVSASTVEELVTALSGPELRLHAMDVDVDFGSADAAVLMRAAARRGIPVVALGRPLVAAGALASFDVDRRDQSRRVAAMIDKVLRGASPASNPVEQPASFVLLLNAKAAAAAGIVIPRALVLRADEVVH